jgi:hypothetical protein
MHDDRRIAPLSRRAPGTSGRRSPPEGFTPPVLPESVQRVARAAIDAAHEQEAAAEQAPPAQAEVEREPPAQAEVERAAPSQAEVERADCRGQAVEPASMWFPANPEADTQPIAAVAMPPATPRLSNPAPPVAYPLIALRPSPPTRRGPRRASRRYRVAGALASVVLLAAGGALAFALWRSTAGPVGGGGQATQGGEAAGGQAVRGQAASWVASQVSTTATVSCDPVMCQALRARGVAAARLLSLGAAGISPLGSQVIVATPTIRAWFGRSLESVYAPGVLASFGSGNLRIDVRVVAPHGAAAYLSAVGTDVLASKASGTALLRSPLITATASARAQLAGGEVDSRLLVTLANLAALEPVSILAFGDLAPGASPGVPLRSADVTASARGAGGGDAAYIRAMVRFLRGQHGLYLAARIQTVRLASGQAALHIEFAAPSPLGLLAPPGGRTPLAKAGS